MRIAGIALTLFAACCLIPSTVQRIRRHRANSERARANRAVQFAEDCLAENRDLRERLASERDLTATYRRANCRLVDFMRDGYDEAEFAEVLSQIETTPQTPFDIAVNTAFLRAALDDDEAVRTWLA